MEDMLFLKKEGIQFPPGKKIIKADEYQTYIAAEQVIEVAKKEAERIIDGRLTSNKLHGWSFPCSLFCFWSETDAKAERGSEARDLARRCSWK